MTRPIPSYLRLHTEDSTEVVRPEVDELASLGEACRSFEQATGWALRYVPGREPSNDPDLMWSAPVDPGVGIAPGHFRIDLGGPALSEHGPRLDLESASILAGSIAALACTLLQTRQALWQREAELAAGVPLVSSSQDATHLAERLEGALRAAAQAVDAEAAGLYLLDAGTTELKLRSCWGLPKTRLTEPPRPLKSAVGDLESLSGHAVVLDNPRLFEAWNVPERNYAHAVCIPVASPTAPLGTLWVYGGQPRVVDDRDTQLLEIVAGRVSAELERAMLLTEGASAARIGKQLEAAERFQTGQLPTIAPVLEGWSLAGRSRQIDRLGGAWYDWLAGRDDELIALVGLADDGGLEGALTSTLERASARAAAEQTGDLAAICDRTARALWTGSQGDRRAGLAALALDPLLGTVRLATAGPAAVLLVRPDRWERLDQRSPSLGRGPDYEATIEERLVSPGDTLVVYALGPADLPLEASGLDEALAEAVRTGSGSPRERIDGVFAALLAGAAERLGDAALLVATRQG
ncbi:MAG: SpoIIE family protein phosphatase [Pirellulales bacterium]